MRRQMHRKEQQQTKGWKEEEVPPLPSPHVLLPAHPALALHVRPLLSSLYPSHSPQAADLMAKQSARDERRKRALQLELENSLKAQQKVLTKEQKLKEIEEQRKFRERLDVSKAKAELDKKERAMALQAKRDKDGKNTLLSQKDAELRLGAGVAVQLYCQYILGG